MAHICFNGKMYDAEQPLFTAQNRGFRYGDGLFETIKVYHNRVLLAGFHFDRLFMGIRMLQIGLPENLNRQELSAQILELCGRNHCLSLARIRLAVYRGEDNKANYVIEAFPLSSQTCRLNDEGWQVDLYPYTRKSCDAFSNLKTANYLPFVLAGLHATEKGLDECLLLNIENNICEASKANLFLIFRNEVFTPALHQGCVNGVMRRYIIDELKKNAVIVHQRDIPETLLLKADEVFLTNAINGMRWVSRFRAKTYTCEKIKDIYRQSLAPLFEDVL